MAAAGGLTCTAGSAAEANAKKPRVALVLVSQRKNSWPYPGFDTAGREEEIVNLLREGCPEIDFVPISIQSSGDQRKAIAMKDDVDGYLVYFVTLSYLIGFLREIGKLGKPTVVADEFLGGSGAYLWAYSSLVKQNTPAGTVSSTRPEDLVAVARCFADVNKPGTTAESFARRCWDVYRETFPKVGDMKCLEDNVALTDIGECVRRFKESRFLILGEGPVGKERDFLGAKGTYLGFKELGAIYRKIDHDEAQEWADRWSKEADRIEETKPEWIHKAAGMYLATLDLLKKHGTDTITSNCLGGFASGELPAYPCLGYKQMLDDGGLGICEAKPDDTVSMLMAQILTGRPGYISDPSLDTSKNQIVYAHCVGPTKVFGPDQPANDYRIMLLHNRDPRGACARSLMPAGYMTTSFRTDFARKLMVIHQAKSAGNCNSPRGCRTQLVGEVRGDIGKTFDYWATNQFECNWHRVTVYGDVKEPLTEFGEALGLKVIEEA